jgi:hypothetical protein
MPANCAKLPSCVLQYLLLGLLLLPLRARAQYTFATNQGTITITGYTGSANDVTLPSSINGLPVTSIGQDAFYGASMTFLTIPDSVTDIGYEAFGQCAALTVLTLPNSITNISSYSFFECRSLASVTIPVNVTEIHSETFGLCSGLTTVTIPQSVTNIQSGAFEDCTGLQQIYFDGNAPAFGMDSFIGVSAATVYYFAGTTGWGATYASLPTVLFNPPPQITGCGFTSNGFSFAVAGTNNPDFVVEASTNLATGTWQPVQTNTETGAPFNFSDFQWSNCPSRFYRLRLP